MEEFKTSGLKFLAYSRFRSMSRDAADSATKVLATDRSLITEIMNFLKVGQNKITLIPNAVLNKSGGNQETLSRLRSDLNIEKADPLFFTVGRLEPNKGIHVLLKALSLTDLPSNWKLVIAGSGTELYNLQKLAQSLRLDEHVKFSGELTEAELTAMYELSDLFINPTLYEGSSIVTLEAMSHGLPIIASNTGGLPDKVDPELNGWLVASNQPEALAQAIQEALARCNEWERMGAASAVMIQEKYSWEKVTPQFVALFENPSYF
jgi:glycosyltransferase involved in cell wall biosynthesis